MKSFLVLFISLFHVALAEAQLLSEKGAVEKALQNYPAIQIALLDVQQRKALEKTAFNPQQPRLTVEAPADNGYGLELEQEFDFPTVYSQRKKWLKSQTSLADHSVALTKNEVVRDVRLAYLDAQVVQTQERHYAVQDSLWRLIVNRATRLFDAGDINRADLIFAERQSGLVKLNLVNAQLAFSNSIAVLGKFIDAPFREVDDLRPLPFDTLQNFESLYFMDYYNQAIHVAESEIKLLQSERLPGIIIGYLKSPEPETSYQHRIKAGITVPIWQGQYAGEIESAKVNIEKTRAESELKIREAEYEHIQLLNTLSRNRHNLTWFENVALPQMKDLTDIYQRLYDAGEVDYALTLRNIAEAFTITSQYLDAIRMHNQAVIELDYLKGTY